MEQQTFLRNKKSFR